MRNLRVQYRNIVREVVIGHGLWRYDMTYDEFSDAHEAMLSCRVGND